MNEVLSNSVVVYYKVVKIVHLWLAAICCSELSVMFVLCLSCVVQVFLEKGVRSGKVCVLEHHQKPSARLQLPSSRDHCWDSVQAGITGLRNKAQLFCSDKLMPYPDYISEQPSKCAR